MRRVRKPGFWVYAVHTRGLCTGSSRPENPGHPGHVCITPLLCMCMCCVKRSGGRQFGVVWEFPGVRWDVYTSTEVCRMSGCVMLTAFCKGSEDTETRLPPTVHVPCSCSCRVQGREGGSAMHRWTGRMRNNPQDANPGVEACTCWEDCLTV